MRSRAQFKSHPIHPAIIPYPFAFLTGAFAFDAIGVVLDRNVFWRTGGFLAAAGILMAVVAAIPGAIDYVYTVPPNSSGKRRATQHMLTNLSAVGLVAAAWMLRQTTASRLSVLALEMVGAALLMYGSYLGGVLVTRNQISVDHRYAGAGKWKEATIPAETGRSFVAARSDELKPNQMKLLRVGNRRVVLARTDTSYVAFDDRCTHRGGSLAGGTMACGTVQCPWHGSQFDVNGGAVQAGPATERIRTYAVDERNGDVRVTIA